MRSRTRRICTCRRQASGRWHNPLAAKVSNKRAGAARADLATACCKRGSHRIRDTSRVELPSRRGEKFVVEVTLFGSWPTKLSTSRSRTAPSITQWARVRACRIRLHTSVALRRTRRVTADLGPYPHQSELCVPVSVRRLTRRSGRLTTHSFPAKCPRGMRPTPARCLLGNAAAEDRGLS